MSFSFRIPPRRRRRRILLPVVLMLVLLTFSGGVVVNLWPDLGGQGADLLREAFGDQVVAQLETTFFQAQDRVYGLAYRLAKSRPAAPWTVAPNDAVSPTVMPSVHPALAGGAAGNTAPQLIAPIVAAPTSAAPIGAAPSLRSAPEWILPPLSVPGTLARAGQWSIYLRDTAGQSVAYRTFLQPDADRPYTIAAIVAFDMRAVRLHFVLGHDEPHSTVAIPRTGKIPAADFKPGILLAAFNGGFKARHGQFGAMADGATALPPKAGLGTVAMYRDGRVRIGAWDMDITDATDLVAWRQNGPLAIQHGQINPHTADIMSHDWGIVLNSVTAVWRSGLGISADGRTLYYVAGNSLTLPALVRALAATGAAAALQLDINSGMVHFDAIESTSSGLAPVPLFDAMKAQRDNRYLIGDKRDYFYVTAHGG